MSSAGSYGGSGGGGVGSVLFLTGNSGGPVAPDLTGNINIVGTGAITVVDTPGTHTLTIELTGSVATVYDADTGSATPTLGILNINGASGIQTTASGNTVIIELSGGGLVESIVGDTGSPISGALFITGGTSGASFDTTGTTITESFNFLELPATDNPLTMGYISFNTNPVLALYGGNSNIFLGVGAGNVAQTGPSNVAIGNGALTNSVSSNSETAVGYLTLLNANGTTGNTAIGSVALTSNTDSDYNTAIGLQAIALLTGTTGDGNNVAVGYNSLGNLLTGIDNIALGTQAGSLYTGTESSNIVIGNDGTTAESHVIRIGTQGSGDAQQNAAYIAGITGSSVGVTNAAVFIDNTGKLGTVGGSSGGVLSITGDAGGALTGAITITGGSSGAFYTGSGGNTLTTTFTKLVMSDTTATTGYIQIGADKVMAAWGGVANNNIAVGQSAGNATMAGTSNTALGSLALNAATSCSSNVSVGAGAMEFTTASSSNTAVGIDALNAVMTGSGQNTAIGSSALGQITTGAFNIGIGSSAGNSYTTSESSNIIIGNSGTAAESHVIRIGTQGSGSGQQNAAYMAGITGSSVGVTNALVYCDNTGKLGTTGGTFPSLGTTNHAVQVGNSSGGLTSLTVGTNGQVLVGSTTADPVFATLTSTGSSITYTTGAGTLNLDLTSPVSIAHGGTNATSMATTDGTVYYDGTRLVTTATGTTGQVLASNGAGVAPTYQSGSGIPLGTTNHAVQVGNSSGTLTSLTVGTNGQVLLGSSAANPVFATLTSTGSSITYTTGAGTLNLDLTSPVSIAHGGTNATSMTTTDGVVYYDGTRLVTTSAGTSGQVLTSNGAGVAPTYQAAAGGGVTSLTGDSGGALTGALTLTGGSSGAVFAGSGTTLTESFNFLALPDTNGAGTVGVIGINGSNVFALYGGSGNSNLYVGFNAGNATISTTGNAGIGTNTQFLNTGGTDNTSLGTFTLAGLTSGNFNTAVGALSLQNVATGGSNTCIGFQSGSSYTAGESGNICVGAPGVASESNTIHIGDGGTQTSCFVGGIAGVTVASSAAVLINTSTGQLGTVVSSRRFKENIEDMGVASRDIYKLRPVKFNLKGDYKESYGLIAEDVEEVMPYLVSYDKEGLPATVKYHELPSLLLNEISSHQASITELERTIQRLKLKIEELEGKFNARVR